MLHLVLHLLIPILVTLIFYPRYGWAAFIRLMAGMIIDVDHIMANPFYDSERCSINYHLFHTPIPIIIYCALYFVPRLRIFSVGLIIHIILDYLNCLGFPDKFVHNLFA
ncbi:MAG: DUF6122 family protein [Adhaeribacter sp.]